MALYQVKDNELAIAISRYQIGLTGDRIPIRFHWMDHVTNVYDLESWFTTGDSAPERRNDYELTLSIPYEEAQDVVLEPREDPITYMRACKLTAEEEEALTVGLSATLYNLPQNYGKMPDFRLIEGNKKETASVSALSAVLFAVEANYALAFEGYGRTEITGACSLILRTNGSIRLWVDGALLGTIPYDAGRTAADITTLEVSLRLEKGYHTIRLEYAETGNGSPVLESAGDLTFYH